MRSTLLGSVLRIALVAGIALAAAACGGADEEGADPEAEAVAPSPTTESDGSDLQPDTPTPTAAESGEADLQLDTPTPSPTIESGEADLQPDTPTPSPTLAPAQTPTPADGGVVLGEVETAARKLLADELEVDVEGLKLDSSEVVEWSDASLGCPQEGYAYAQVITPGHKLVFDLAGASYAVHTNLDGSHMVVCGDGMPTPAAGGAVLGEMETAARKLLADELEVDAGSLKLASSEMVEWSDTSLGCPQEGYAYAQVVTPGHKVVFDLAGASYAVHTNLDGSHMVVCGDGR